jgi:hypothetical protein
MRGIRSRTKVGLDRKERLDIVRGNRRLGGDIDFEERGSPRRFRQITYHASPTQARSRHKFRIALIRHKRA